MTIRRLNAEETRTQRRANRAAPETEVRALTETTGTASVLVRSGGVDVATRPTFNYLDSSDIGFTAADDAVNQEVELSASIKPDAVTLAKLADISTSRLLGRITAGTGDPEALTGTQATTLLDVFTAALKGLVPASGGGTSNFLRADGTWTSPGASSFVMTEYEVNLGSTPLFSGSFDITGLSGLTPGAQVLVQQKAASYTGKGTLTDESEMDQVQAAGYVVNATTIRVYWVVPARNGPVMGNFKFGYVVSG